MTTALDRSASALEGPLPRVARDMVVYVFEEGEDKPERLAWSERSGAVHVRYRSNGEAWELCDAEAAR